MKKLIFVFSALLASCSIFDRNPSEKPLEKNVPIRARVSSEPMKRVFVLPFVDVSQKKSLNVIDSARRVFVAELLRTNEYVVVKNNDFPKDFEIFKNNNEYDLQKIAHIAQSVGVNAAIEGQILEVRAKKIGDDVGIVRKVRAQVEAKVRIRAYGGELQKEVFNEVRSATVEATTTRFAEKTFTDRDLEDDPALVNEAVQKAFQSLIPSLSIAMRKLSWVGRIAMVKGEKIFINAGRISGIQVGDLLKVMDQGQDIYDPQTGTFLGRAEGRMKGTIEIVSYFGKDGAIGVIHSGADFRENDKVELY